MQPAVTILVPVMRRPRNAAPFIESCDASTDRAAIVAIADTNDQETWEAWHPSRTLRSTWPDPGGSFAQKVNLGYRSSPWTEWLFLCGDDVCFHPGWLEAAIAEAGDRYDVVGTNDLGTGVSNHWSPHLLIRRSYIERYGASWDGPGVVCHEGYRHSYVDNEICRTALQRGAWVMAWDSIVEHLHPAYRKADDDPIYRLGQTWVDADAAVWTARREEFGA